MYITPPTSTHTNSWPYTSLKDAEGNIVSSVELLKRGPLVVSFYRGVWCPYCNMELQAILADPRGEVERGFRAAL